MTPMTRTWVRSIAAALVVAAASVAAVSAQTASRPAPKAAAAPQASAPAPAKAAPVTPAAAAAPAQNPRVSPAAKGAVPAPAAEAPPDVYSYNPEGRRDPFVSLIIKGSEAGSRDNRPEGAAGLSVGEIRLCGIVKSRSEFVALVQGPDKKTYIVHAGDKLYDGSIKLIAGDAVVFAQDVNDPLSLVKQREIRKALRSTEEGK